MTLAAGRAFMVAATTTLSCGKTMSRTDGILYLDLEGGWGGSSRSMFHLIEYIDRMRFRPFAVTRRDGPIAQRYASLGVPHINLPTLPSFRPAERKNAVAYAIYRWDSRKLTSITAQLQQIKEREGIRLIHVNHESLALTGRHLARRLGLPWVCHVRTQLIPGRFAKWVYGVIARDAAHVIFISERNLEHFQALSAVPLNRDRASVVYNIAPPIPENLEPLPEISEPASSLRMVSLTNFSPNRGVDRVVDVAQVLARRGRTDIVFFLCGRLANTRRLPFARNRYLESIERRVAESGLAKTVRFPGHVSRPDRALVASQGLIKLSRVASPWGRDILEAMSAGRAVVTLGDFQGIVEDGVNGFIDRDFNAEAIADHLVRLRDEPALRQRIAQANREKAARLFDGKSRGREVAEIYERVLAA